MKNIFNKFFPEKNENYVKALTGLKNVKKSFDGFVISFPDVTPNEIMFIKEKWEELPKTISNGVKIMALDIIGNYKSLLTSYKPNSYIKPHKHNGEYEFGLVIKGELIDKFNGNHYKIGDEYKINPNEVHYLSASNDGCLVYSTLTSDSKFNMKPLPKKITSTLDLT